MKDRGQHQSSSRGRDEATEEVLKKTFLLARRGTEPPAAELPFGMETAVIAHWRSKREKGDTAILPVFRWAALLAVTVAVLSGAWKRDVIVRIADRSYPEITIANSAFTEIE